MIMIERRDCVWRRLAYSVVVGASIEEVRERFGEVLFEALGVDVLATVR